MSFVQKIIGPDEKLVGVAYIHWIYAMKGVVWLMFFMAMGIIFDFGFTNYASRALGTAGFVIGNSGFWIFTVVGLVLSFFYFVMWIATEVGLTTKRVIFKRGLFFVDVKELDLEEIKATDIDNGLLGVPLKYGYIRFDARFVENITLPAIVKPYRFVQALNDMRSHLKEDSVQPILQGRENDNQGGGNNKKNRKKMII